MSHLSYNTYSLFLFISMELSSVTNISVQLWTIIWVIIAIVTFTTKMTSFRDKMDFRITNLEVKCTDAIKDIEALESKGNDISIALAEYRKDIKMIFEILAEMKKLIK